MQKPIQWDISNCRKPLSLTKKEYFYNRNLKAMPINLRVKDYLCVPIIFLFKFLKKININLRIYPELFGHQSFDIEYFLKTRPKRSIDIFICSSVIPNKFLYKKHKKLLFITVLPKSVFNIIKRFNKISLALSKKTIFSSVSFEYKWLYAASNEWGTKSFLTFSKEEVETGNRFLKENNLEKFQYVLYSNRDNIYYLKQNEKLYNSRGWDKKNSIRKIRTHENSLAQKYRNMNFYDYEKSILFLSNQNIKSVRIGAFQNKIKIKDNNFLDFAGNQRSDLGIDGEFLDFYLLHHCKFLVNCSGGLNAAIMTTDRPSLVVNNFPFPWISSPTRSKDMYIPKLYSNDEYEFINFSDLVALSTLTDWRSMYDNKDFFKQNKNLKAIDNTPEEILNAIIDMNRVVDNQYNMGKEEMLLRSDFAKLIKKDSVLALQKSTICYSFLKKYKHLLY